MKKMAIFDKVKDYFKSSITELKTDKTYQKRFIIASCIEFVLLAFTIVLDLCMKEYLYDFWVANGKVSYTVVKGFLDITYTQNTGAAFGSFSDGTLALTIVTTIVIVGIMGYLLIAKRNEMWMRIALVFVAGGGIGNLVDRIGLGYVRDFFEFTFTTKWGIFNIADCFVSVGAVMMVCYLIYVLIKDFMVTKKNKTEEIEENDILSQSNNDEADENANENVLTNADEIDEKITATEDLDCSTNEE